jgi:hypothetical protein
VKLIGWAELLLSARASGAGPRSGHGPSTDYQASAVLGLTCT